jgi:hypothetical protein
MDALGNVLARLADGGGGPARSVLLVQLFGASCPRPTFMNAPLACWSRFWSVRWLFSLPNLHIRMLFRWR